MITKTRRRMLAGCDGQTLVCASLFSVAALICALGNGALGLLVFFRARCWQIGLCHGAESHVSSIEV